MSFLTAPIVKNSYSLAVTYIISLKIVLKQCSKAFNTKFQPQFKDQKSCLQGKQILETFVT